MKTGLLSTVLLTWVMPLAVLGANPKPASSPAPVKKAPGIVTAAKKSTTSAKPAPAKKASQRIENSKASKKAVASRKSVSKARKAAPAAEAKEKAPPPKPVTAVKKKSPPARASSARAESIPVIRRNSSEYIDLTYPPRAGARPAAEAKKAPEKPARKPRKRSTTPEVETEEIPGISREQETAVASSGPVRP